MALLQSSLFHISNHSISPSNSNNTQIPKFNLLRLSNSSKFLSLNHSIAKDDQIFIIKCTGQDSIIRTADGGDGGNGKGGYPPDNAGGSGGGGGDDGDYDEEEFGPIVKFDEMIREAEKRGASLPSDMLEAAKTTGLRSLILSRYLDLQGSAWPLGFLMRHCSMLRNRMLADPSFLFKVGTEIVIDSCCATFAEVQKRGKDFWAEFELYAADLLVGIVVDVALVSMLAPYVRIGKQSVSSSSFGRFRHACGALPSR